MALSIEEIKKLITSSIPDASIEIKDLMGDSNHYSAKITSKLSPTTLTVLVPSAIISS